MNWLFLSLLVMVAPFFFLSSMINKLKPKRWSTTVMGIVAGFIIWVIIDSSTYIIGLLDNLVLFIVFYSVVTGIFQEAWRFFYMTSFHYAKKYHYSFGLGWGLVFLLFNGFSQLVVSNSIGFLLRVFLESNFFLVLQVFLSFIIYTGVRKEKKKKYYFYVSTSLHSIILLLYLLAKDLLGLLWFSLVLLGACVLVVYNIHNVYVRKEQDE